MRWSTRTLVEAVDVSARSPTMSRSAGTAPRWPTDEVVVDPDVVAAGQEQPDGVAADVAGAAGDEDAHGRSVAQWSESESRADRGSSLLTPLDCDCATELASSS